ncbi:MAG TPA: CCA tRNA nucleotidyltransferase [Candidatus Paceibacterota bacterium]
MATKLIIPDTISRVTETISQANFSAYLVGGCVRDLLMSKTPKDWDVATDAKPGQIASLFPKTFYENAYGTVTVVNEKEADLALRNVEVTPFRKDAKYSDKRHPDKVTFSDTIEEDLGRRDFTINAIAYEPSKRQIIDIYGGQTDIKDKVVRAVGQPTDRLDEDPLRIMRGVRLATELSFMINNETMEAMQKKVDLLSFIAQERIRDEFSRIILSNNLMTGIITLHQIGALKQFLPELEEGVHMKQNGDHIYDVWEHTLRVAQHAADKNWPFHVRLAALFHDIGKPRTREWGKEKNDWTFYGHDVIGARMTRKIMGRLKFGKQLSETVERLVRYHMFFSDIDKITLSAVRRIIRNVSRENIWDLMHVRNCDRIGMGRPKESPYRLRKYESMIEEALRSPTSVSMLKIKGEDVLRETGITPGPKVGHILHALLEETLEKPELNNEDYLKNRIKELVKLSDQELENLGQQGKDKKSEIEEEELKKIRDKYSVH